MISFKKNKFVGHTSNNQPIGYDPILIFQRPFVVSSEPPVKPGNLKFNSFRGTFATHGAFSTFLVLFPVDYQKSQTGSPQWAAQWWPDSSTALRRYRYRRSSATTKRATRNGDFLITMDQQSLLIKRNTHWTLNHLKGSERFDKWGTLNIVRNHRSCWVTPGWVEWWQATAHCTNPGLPPHWHPGGIRRNPEHSCNLC